MNDDPEFAPTLADVLALFHRRAGNEYTRDMAGKVRFSLLFSSSYGRLEGLTSSVLCTGFRGRGPRRTGGRGS